MKHALTGILVALLFAARSSAVASPILAPFVDDVRCDPVAATLHDELGTAPPFPPWT